MSAMAFPPAHKEQSEQCDTGPGHSAITTLGRDGRGKLSTAKLPPASEIMKKSKNK